MWTRKPPWHKHLGGVEKLKVTFYVLFSFSAFTADLTPLTPETCWNLTPRHGSQDVLQSALRAVTTETASLQRVPFF